MQLADFNYPLPSHLIAEFPLAERGSSKLLAVDRRKQILSHHSFSRIYELLQTGDLIIFNNTKVIPARLIAYKKTGGRVEILLERILDERCVLAQLKANKKIKEGDKLQVDDELIFAVQQQQGQLYELHYSGSGAILDIIEQKGSVPLPPYIRRAPTLLDKERYQTIYAKHKGSVAAPTAGLHFDEQGMNALRDKKVELGFLTLHVGAGTFKPVRTEKISEHIMHKEYFTIPEQLASQVHAAKARGNRVVAVGTTSVRALESAWRQGQLQKGSAETAIFIYPGYQFRCVDALITNFHLPCSTLLMLVCAFGGYELIMQAYQVAIEKKYRFFSYGDAMWIE